MYSCGDRSVGGGVDVRGVALEGRPLRAGLHTLGVDPDTRPRPDGNIWIT
jgi:hypothetical protein